MEFERKKEHARNLKLENLLEEVNSILAPAEEKILENYVKPKFPIIFIVGCGRSGTTLLLQWLAYLNIFGYPTNLLSRFYRAPYIGIKIQQILTEYDHNNEIFDFGKEAFFSSNLGKTKGALSPNEFWYFWRRFFTSGDIPYLDETALQKVNTEKFVAELAAVEAVLKKPLVMKALIMNWNIPFVASLFDRVLFIYIKRDSHYNIQSLLEARIKYFGDRRAWYSFKPREYGKLKELDPFSQVAGQVFYTNNAVEQGLHQIDMSRQLHISYEELCDGPEKIYSQITEKLAQQGCRIEGNYTGHKKFHSTNKTRLPKEEFDKIVKAYKYFQKLN